MTRKKIWKEIRVNDVTDAVSSTIEELYAGYEISEVHCAFDGSYKLKLEKGNEKATA